MQVRGPLDVQGDAMKKSSDMYKQILKAQRAMTKWPKEWLDGIVIIPIKKMKP